VSRVPWERGEALIRSDEAARIAQREAKWLESVPAKFKGARIDQLEPELQDEIRAWLDPADPSYTLIFNGECGTGKSHAAYAALLEAVRAGKQVEAWRSVQMLDAFRPGPDDHCTYTRLCKVPVLMIDDLGVEKSSEFTESRLNDLVDARYTEQLPLVVTMNFHIDTMDAKLGRVVSRLRDVDASRLVAMGGKDRRRRSRIAPRADETGSTTETGATEGQTTSFEEAQHIVDASKVLSLRRAVYLPLSGDGTPVTGPKEGGPAAPASFDDLQDLIASIAIIGVVQPVLVAEVDGQHRLLSGERRLLACQWLQAHQPENPHISKGISAYVIPGALPEEERRAWETVQNARLTNDIERGKETVGAGLATAGQAPPPSALEGTTADTTAKTSGTRTRAKAQSHQPPPSGPAK
jgi:hypothetical protein